MRVDLVRIGNSKGIRLPKAVIEQPQLTDAGLEHLKRLPTLTSVMLDECPNLTQAAVKELSHVLRRHMHEIAD